MTKSDQILDEIDTNLPAGWALSSLAAVVEMKYRKGLIQQRRRPGDVPVYGSNGVVGQHDNAVTAGATIIIGRKGSVGEVHLCPRSCWPIDTTYFIDDDRAVAAKRSPGPSRSNDTPLPIADC